MHGALLGLSDAAAFQAGPMRDDRLDHGVSKRSESGTATEVGVHEDPQVEVRLGLAAATKQGLGVEAWEQGQAHPLPTSAALQGRIVERPADRKVGKGGLADPRPIHMLALPPDPLLALPVDGLV